MIQLILNSMTEVEDAIDYLMMLCPCSRLGRRMIRLVLVRNRTWVLLAGMLLGIGLLTVLGARICGARILCSLLFLFSLIRLLFLLFFAIYLYYRFWLICSLYLIPCSIDQHPQFPYLLQSHLNCPSIIH